ncbi:hypothetical protein KY321_00285 [Candidatus Woesearchaeota archaeon]|nr:hypothetical protein [Candidatus Woesearchaeota archaeon]
MLFLEEKTKLYSSTDYEEKCPELLEEHKSKELHNHHVQRYELANLYNEAIICEQRSNLGSFYNRGSSNHSVSQINQLLVFAKAFSKDPIDDLDFTIELVKSYFPTISKLKKDIIKRQHSLHITILAKY